MSDESPKFSVNVSIRDGLWDIVVSEGDEPRVTQTVLTTDEVVAKFGELFLAWTKPKR